METETKRIYCGEYEKSSYRLKDFTFTLQIDIFSKNIVITLIIFMSNYRSNFHFNGFSFLGDRILAKKRFVACGAGSVRVVAKLNKGLYKQEKIGAINYGFEKLNR